ncbi:universal stress protein [Halorubraceae archaeon YAN]|nr:universal stress protein [Halorubraceae archaeon YAN]
MSPDNHILRWIMYDRILYPTDGSEGAECALKHARTIGEQFGGTVHILFVVDAGFKSPMQMRKDEHGRWTTGMVRRQRDDPAQTGMTKDDVDIGDVLEREGTELTTDIVAELEKNGIDAVATVDRGDPANVIERYAEEHEIDVIVMGTHGRSGLERRLIGSVTEHIIRHSQTPVLSVRLEQEAEA